MHVVSNLGLQGEFAVDPILSNGPNPKGKGDNKPISSSKEEQI